MQDISAKELKGHSAKKIRKASRPSVLKRLGQFKELVKHAVHDKTKRKERER